MERGAENVPVIRFKLNEIFKFEIRNLMIRSNLSDYRQTVTFF